MLLSERSQIQKSVCKIIGWTTAGYISSFQGLEGREAFTKKGWHRSVYLIGWTVLYHSCGNGYTILCICWNQWNRIPQRVNITVCKFLKDQAGCGKHQGEYKL